MTRAELIERVKVKLEEISPLDEPNSFITADSMSEANRVKPIVSYIDQTLDQASWKCLSELPISILALDIDRIEDVCEVSPESGVGTYQLMPSSTPRFVRVKAETWKKDCTVIISSSNAISLLQDNKFTRGGECKPAVVYTPEYNCLSLYSFNDREYLEERYVEKLQASVIPIDVWTIDCSKKAETVQSDIADFIALQCAIYVYEILGRADYAQILLQEYGNKLQLIL